MRIGVDLEGADLPPEAIRAAAERYETVCYSGPTSIQQGIDAVAAHEIDGFLTCCSTGALIRAATLTLPLLPGIRRPALLAEIPLSHHRLILIDAGANAAARPEQLMQFAWMGWAYANAMGYGKRVALLNVGVEPTKGPRELQEAYKRLQALEGVPFEFVGNVEPYALERTDVLVSGGFAGNILLKTMEGMTPHRQGTGAIVAGVEGLLVKCHGGATAEDIRRGLQMVERLHQARLGAALQAALQPWAAQMQPPRERKATES